MCPLRNDQTLSSWINHRSPTWPVTRLVVMILLLAPGIADAARFLLADGSVVHGRILNLTDGEHLRVYTEHMGEVVIDWDAIERIENTENVNVELFSGERFSGRLDLGGGALRVDPLDGAPRELAPGQVYALDERQLTGWQGLVANVDLGLNIVRGNNRVTQVSYGAGLTYHANAFSSGLDMRLIVNEQTDAPDTQRLTVNGFHDQKLSGRWSAGGLYQYESDELQQLEGRSLLAGVMSFRPLNNRIRQLTLSAGVAVNAEDFETTAPTQTPEGVLGAVYRLRSRWGLDLDATLYVLPSFSDTDRVRLRNDTTLALDLIGDLDLRVVYYNRFDSEPPVAVSEFDYGVTLGVGYEF